VTLHYATKGEYRIYAHVAKKSTLCIIYLYELEWLYRCTESRSAK